MEKLQLMCSKIGISLDDTALKRFDIYMRLVIEWNEKINLTAITEREEFIVKHLYDSLTLLSIVQIGNRSKIIDVGTGAGFPGIPLLIARPDIQLTLLDSLNKRMKFLKDYVLPEIGLCTEVIHGRAEELSKTSQYREKYDFAVSRAVANLSSLSEYCMPFVRVNGLFVSMKGPNIEEELNNAENAVNTLGGKVKKVENLVLPDESTRNIVVIEKVSKTPDKFPRRGVKISKNPL